MGNIRTKTATTPTTKGIKAQTSKVSIVMAARICFASKGLFDATMDDIQAAAGVSRGKMYYHFKNKDEIVQTVIEENLGAMALRIEAIVAQSREQHLTFENILVELTSFAEQITFGPGKGMAFHVWSYAMINEPVRAMLGVFFRRIRALLEQEIDTLQQLGKLPQAVQPKEAATALFGLIIPGFTVQRSFLENEAIDAKTYIKTIFSVFGLQSTAAGGMTPD